MFYNLMVNFYLRSICFVSRNGIIFIFIEGISYGIVYKSDGPYKVIFENRTYYLEQQASHRQTEAQ